MPNDLLDVRLISFSILMYLYNILYLIIKFIVSLFRDYYECSQLKVFCTRKNKILQNINSNIIVLSAYMSIVLSFQMLQIIYKSCHFEFVKMFASLVNFPWEFRLSRKNDLRLTKSGIGYISRYIIGYISRWNCLRSPINTVLCIAIIDK